MKIIRAILVVLFVVEGVMKLAGLPFQVDAFRQWGYPLWFMYIIGTLELLGAIGLLIPKLRLYANIGLIGIMIGAFYTHISSGNPIYMMGVAIVASVLLIWHLVLMRRQAAPGA